MGQLAPQLRADRIKFMAAGREDMDVRMLGGGRPFVLEVLNARELPLSNERCEALQVGVSLPHRNTHLGLFMGYSRGRQWVSAGALQLRALSTLTTSQQESVSVVGLALVESVSTNSTRGKWQGCLKFTALLTYARTSPPNSEWSHWLRLAPDCGTGQQLVAHRETESPVCSEALSPN